MRKKGRKEVLIRHQTKYMKRISEKNNVSVPKITTKKSLKFQLVDMKANSSILMTLKMPGVT